MRVVAAQMRTEALINLEERANRLPAIMTVPMMLFIMPVIFLIVGGPAVLRLLDMLAHK
jgi:tight adherence protein C